MAQVNFNKPTQPQPEFELAKKYPSGTLCVTEDGHPVIVMSLPVSAMIAYRKASTGGYGSNHEYEHRQRFISLVTGKTAPYDVVGRRLRADEQPLKLTNKD